MANTSETFVASQRSLAQSVCKVMLDIDAKTLSRIAGLKLLSSLETELDTAHEAACSGKRKLLAPIRGLVAEAKSRVIAAMD